MIPILALLLAAFPAVKSYTFLTAPDGQIPLPEVRATDTLTSAVQPGGEYRDASYYVKRWIDSKGRDNWVCICLKTSFEPRANLHVHGFSYSYWCDGKWVARPEAYSGYDPKKLTEDECTWNSVPCGIFGPTWRITPPRITVSVHGDTIIQDYGQVKRVIVVGDSLTVTDGR